MNAREEDARQGEVLAADRAYVSFTGGSGMSVSGHIVTAAHMVSHEATGDHHVSGFEAALHRMHADPAEAERIDAIMARVDEEQATDSAPVQLHVHNVVNAASSEAQQPSTGTRDLHDEDPLPSARPRVDVAHHSIIALAILAMVAVVSILTHDESSRWLTGGLSLATILQIISPRRIKSQIHSALARPRRE
ncbi:hypothetical protein AB0D74_11410 [Streptomyces sp. NPDC048278]|uniref:hypothetical protein n=1 Tax=Streptomyces sp. NPDC048278 TaxID=3155809 RepID=UPI00344104B2